MQNACSMTGLKKKVRDSDVVPLAQLRPTLLDLREHITVMAETATGALDMSFPL